jgi:hypothetical protein
LDRDEKRFITSFEHSPVEVGALQVLGGETYSFNGKEWLIRP